MSSNTSRVLLLVAVVGVWRSAVSWRRSDAEDGVEVALCGVVLTSLDVGIGGMVVVGSVGCAVYSCE